MKFKVLQWNISYLEPIADIAATIKATGADLVCLQELTANYQSTNSDTGKFLSEFLGYESHYKYGLMPLPDGNWAQMGNGIFSRFPLSLPRVFDLQEGTVLKYPRYYLDANIDLDSQQLKAGTLHLPFRPSFRTTNFKRLLADRLLSAAGSTASMQVIAGDFNSTTDSAVIQKLKANFNLAGPGRRVKTWTKQPFAIAGHEYNQLSWRIDHVFYAGQLKPISAQALNVKPSDHRPVLVEFEF